MHNGFGPPLKDGLRAAGYVQRPSSPGLGRLAGRFAPLAAARLCRPSWFIPLNTTLQLFEIQQGICFSNELPSWFIPLNTTLQLFGIQQGICFSNELPSWFIPLNTTLQLFGIHCH